MFQHVEPFGGDPILSLNEDFLRDPRTDKVNLTIGIYFDEDGRIPVLECVRRAEAQLAANTGPKPYLPIEGAAPFIRAVQELLFGADHEVLRSGRVATMQAVGSTGGLKIGAEFIKQWFPGSEFSVSDPTWENHTTLFRGIGLAVKSYPYFDAATGGVKFDEMLAALAQAPERSVVLLHACCHNPTGADLTPAQWRRLVPVLRDRKLIPYLDMAYQGFGTGLVEDAQAVRLLADEGLSFFVANSFSKSMSVYGERCGALSVVTPDAKQAQLVLGQLRYTIRRSYSSPAIHSGMLAATVLTDKELRPMWEGELAAMRDRMLAMRKRLHEALCTRLPGRNFDYLVQQRGMFSYTGLTAAQAERLREEFGVYLLRSGRMCIAGLNERNVERTAAAIAAVLA